MSGPPSWKLALSSSSPPSDMGGVVWLLFDRALPALAPHELEAIADAAEMHACGAARGSAEVAVGVGSLVAADRKSGSFTGAEDLTDVLLHLADGFSNIATMLELARSARVHLKARARRQHSAEGAPDA